MPRPPQIDHATHSKVERELDDRLRFETLISDLSTAFLALAPDGLDRAMREALRNIAKVLGFDRAAVFDVLPESRIFVLRNSYATPEVTPISVVPSMRNLPWLTRTLLDGRTVVLSRIPEELPEDAAAERAYYRKEGIRSDVGIPLLVGGLVTGVASFGSFHEVVLSDRAVDRLRLLGQIFASTLARHHAGSLLRRSEARFRAMIEDQAELIVRWLPDGTRTFVNDAYCRAFGTRDGLIGTSLMDGLDEVACERLQQCVASLTRDAATTSEERLAELADGKAGWQRWTHRGIFDGRGELVELQSVGHDVTERKLAETALRESEARYRSLVEAAPEAIVVLDVDTQRFVDMNRNATRLFGYSKEQLLRLNPGDVSPPLQPDGRNSVEAGNEHSQRALDGETPCFEWVHRDSGGREVCCEIRLSRVPSSNRRLVRGSCTDISERKLLERQFLQSQKMEALGRLAGGVAHDFNNLLTAVYGNAELALDDARNQGVRDHLREILSAAERATGLTRQLLTFSRHQIGHPEIVAVNNLVRDLGELLGRLIGEDIEIAMDLSAGDPRSEVDRIQLEQVVVNLAVNARDAMPRGGRLTVTTSSVELDGAAATRLGLDPGAYVLLEVADTGSGIAPEIRPRVFEPFFTTKPAGKGTGLGLSTAYGIVRRAGGQIELECPPAGGTCVRVLLPATSRPVTVRLQTPLPRSRGTETILLVEDEPAVRRLACAALRQSGYTVLEASNGRAALEIATELESRIDLLVSDVIMPEMDGPDLARTLSAGRPELPVLFVSGYPGDRLSDRGVDESVAFLSKPYTPSELAHSVRCALDGDGQRRT